MAKVCRHYVKINGQQKAGDIHYTASTKTFHYSFPDEIVVWGKVKYPDKKYLVLAPSQAELEKKIDALVQEYEAEAMKERKIIVFTISSKSTKDEMAEDMAETEDEWDRQKVRERFAGKDHAIELELRFNILLERTVGSNVCLFRQELDRDGNPYWDACSTWDFDEWHRIDWTEASEKFFHEIYSGMETLASRLDKFAGSPERVKKAITNHARLLEAPKEKS